jgi:peptide/nickel transport system substrate-binding protein
MLRGPRVLVGLLAAVAVATAGCGSSSPSPTEAPATGTPTQAPTPAPAGVSAAPSPTGLQIADTSYKPTAPATTGGKLTIGGWEYPDTLMPYFARYPYDLQLSSAMFDGLLKVTPNLRYLPNLVTGVPTLDNGGVVLSGNGMAVTWDLKEGMKWSDGQPITCDDIKATWQWIVDRANTGLANGTAGWQDVTGVDGGTGVHCLMHFGRVYEGYLSLVDPLLPGHYLSKVPVGQARTKLYSMDDLASGVYSGPYLPVSAVSHSRITFKPNTQYATVSGHAPYLDSVEWRYFGDATGMIGGFAAGGLGLAQDLTEANIPALTLPATQVVVHDSLTYELLAFNNASFASKYGADATMIIRAVELAVDRGAIASGPLGGTVSVPGNFVSPLSWFHKPVEASTAPDVASAKTLMANMGWSPGSDGILAKSGKSLVLDLCTTNRQVRIDTLTLIAGQLKAIGIGANVKSQPASTVFGSWKDTKPDAACSLVHGNFDVAEFSYVSSLDPAPGFTAYVSSQTPENTSDHGGQNLTRIQNAILDQNYQTIVSTVDLNKIRQAMASIQDVYASDRNTFELPLYFRKDVWLTSPSLHNFVGGPTFYGGAWNIGDWWLG